MNAVEIRGLSKTYKNGVQALKGIDLNIPEGDFFALLGPNGAGKSTLLKILSTVSKKDEGKILIDGHDLDENLFLAKLRLGITPQEVNLNIFQSALDALVIQAGYFGIPKKHARKRGMEVLEALSLADKANTRIGSLSGGMKRRLMIARSIIHEPKILILDEPTAGVDIEIRHSMWEYVKSLNESGVTILLTTHYLEEAEQLCENISIIDQGEILMNTSMKDLLAAKYSKTFILNVSEFSGALPEIPDVKILESEAGTLEVELKAESNLNALFEALSKAGLSVYNLRNKTNRLEELFIKLTSHPDPS